MPAEAPPTLIPGVPDDTTLALVTIGGVLVLLVAAPLVAWLVRRGLDKAGLQGPTPHTPGLDWGRIAGLMAGFTVVAVGVPMLFPGTDASVRRILQSVISALRPLAAPMFILAAADHYRRVWHMEADRQKGPERDRLVQRAEQLRIGGFVAAAVALVGDGLWSAWPLAVVALVVWAMHDPTLRPLFDRLVADLQAGHRLRKRSEWTEGMAVEVDGVRGVLAGPVGIVNTRVALPEGERVVRNVELVATLSPVEGPGHPDAQSPPLSGEVATASLHPDDFR